MVTLKTYDGRDVKGFIFIRENNPKLHKEHLPSKRYMDILIAGAKRAGLRKSYLQKLQEMETYSPPGWLLKVRAERPPLKTLPKISLEELAQHNGTEDFW